MKRKNIMTGLLAIALFALPALSFANTYQFVDTSGNLQSMEADTPEIALATAYQLGIHSGVVLANSGGIGGAVLGTYTPTTSTPTTSGSGNYYQFIDTSGNIQGVWAANASIALATAYQLGIHSGVVLGTNL